MAVGWLPVVCLRTQTSKMNFCLRRQDNLEQVHLFNWRIINREKIRTLHLIASALYR